MKSLQSMTTRVTTLARRRGVAHATVLASLAITSTGCSTPADGDRTADQSQLRLEATFEERTGVPLEDAVEKLGMSTQTHEIYMRAVERGYVLASDVTAVIPDLQECIAPLGFSVEHDPTQTGYFGLPDVTWSVVVPEGHEMSDLDDAVITSCADKTVGPLENAFFNQPESPERVDVWSTDGRRELAQACIEEAGYLAPDDGSMQQYIDVARRVIASEGNSECLDIVLYGPG